VFGETAMKGLKYKNFLWTILWNQKLEKKYFLQRTLQKNSKFKDTTLNIIFPCLTKKQLYALWKKYIFNNVYKKKTNKQTRKTIKFIKTYYLIHPHTIVFTHFKINNPQIIFLYAVADLMPFQREEKAKK
jgi:hypothetical protein